MNFLDLFAQKLREKREQKKITQRELADVALQKNKKQIENRTEK